MAKKRRSRGTWMRLISSDTLKALMEQKHYTHERMSRYAGCSRGFISHLTSGRKRSCSEPLADRIAEALDVPRSLLFVEMVSPATGRVVPQRERPTG